MKNVELTIEGKRAMLVPMEIGHVQGLFKAGNSSDIWAYMPRKVETLEDMNILVKEALEAKDYGTEYPFSIIDKETHQIVGSTRFLDISEVNKSLEIGWTWLSPSVWRTEINTECKYLLLNHCFEKLGLIRVQIKTDGRNLRSQKAIERLGAVKEGVLRSHRIMYNGYIRDSVYYSIISKEWPEVKSRLENFIKNKLIF